MRELTREEWNARFPDREPFVASQRSNKIFSANITHNLNRMASAANLYECCWRPGELGITHAHQMISPLRTGLGHLKENPSLYKFFNPSNGWGSYETLVEFVTQYLDACEKYPQATVSVWR